jgi:hypothetical protein
VDVCQLRAGNPYAATTKKRIAQVDFDDEPETGDIGISETTDD